MIELRSVTVTYRRDGAPPVTALRGVDLRIEDGECHCLLGTSGCGKTTALRTINRLVEPTSGTVLVDGAPNTTVDPIALRRRIGYVIQSGGLFPHMTVLRNVGLPAELQGWAPARARARAVELLELVGLPAADFGNRHPRELSGGQRQRVSVARALCLDPPCLLMDEPFSALDPIGRRGLRRQIRALLRRVNKTVVLVTHDIEEAFELGDRVSVMDAGTVVQTGTPAELRQDPAPFVARFLKGEEATDDE